MPPNRMFRKEKEPKLWKFVVLYVVAGIVGVFGFENTEHALSRGFDPWPGIGFMTLGVVIGAVTGTVHYMRTRDE